MTEQDLEGMTITKLAPQIRSKRASPVELTDALIARVEALDPQLNAFLLPTPERAREQARAASFERWLVTPVAQSELDTVMDNQATAA